MTRKRTMNQMGLFNLADFQQAKAFQSKVQIKIIDNSQGEILSWEINGVNPRSIAYLIEQSI